MTATVPGSRGASSTIRSIDDARRRSIWLDRPRSLPEFAPLERDTTAELLVIGAGLTGLWAAIEAAAAGLSEIVVVDSGAVGGGASGRCGGFINASITHGIAHGHSRWPDEMARIVRLQEALWDDTLDLLRSEGAGDVIVPAGKLTVATNRHHAAGLAGSVEILRQYGQDAELLDERGVRELVDSPTYLGGYRHRTANGVCDPARLTDVLATLASRRGAQLAERTHVTGLTRDRRGSIVARTSTGGAIRAERVLLATNASPPLRRRLRHRVIPVYDHVIATAPLRPDQWEAIGWREPFGITDAGNQFHYYRATPTGGILFGGWDATYHFGGRVDEQLEQRGATHRLLAEHLVATFPQLDGIEITHAWGGPIDSTSRFTPTFGTAWDGRLGWAIGFTGLGVGASRFAALASLDLLSGRSTERTGLSMVRRAPIPFPPEPLRWPVIALTKRALAAEDRTGRRGPWLRLLHRLGVGFDT